MTPNENSSVLRSVDMMLSEMRSLREQMREDRQELNNRLASLEIRLRGIEKWRAWILGAAAVVGAIVSLATTLGLLKLWGIP